MKTTTVRPEDMEIVKALFRCGSRFGDPVKELAEECGCSSQRLIAVAKRYEGIKFKGGVLGYIPSSSSSWASDLPGIKNPRTGVCAYIPAEITVRRKRSKRA